jgi:uncharacterized membrane protein YfcA
MIPTLFLLFGVDIDFGGSLSLAMSLPTMLVGFPRYGRNRSFVILSKNRRFVLMMASGSILGSCIGGCPLCGRRRIGIWFGSGEG